MNFSSVTCLENKNISKQPKTITAHSIHVSGLINFVTLSSTVFLSKEDLLLSADSCSSRNPSQTLN